MTIVQYTGFKTNISLNIHLESEIICMQYFYTQENELKVVVAIIYFRKYKTFSNVELNI